MLSSRDFRNHYCKKEIVSGGGGHDKENFFERHYFLRLQKQFPEKWGAHAPPPVPTALKTNALGKKVP